MHTVGLRVGISPLVYFSEAMEFGKEFFLHVSLSQCDVSVVAVS